LLAIIQETEESLANAIGKRATAVRVWSPLEIYGKSTQGTYICNLEK